VTQVGDACAELAQLTPHLAPALTRDNTAAARITRWEAPLSPVNTDVLAAIITLRYQIPAVTIRAAQLVNEPWQPRTHRACLVALPRLDERLGHLGHVSEHKHLETITSGWVRLTKRALGLRKPDIPLSTECPVCIREGNPIPGLLYVTGAEARVRQSRHGTTLEWSYDPHVYCPVGPINPDDPPHRWPQGQWELLVHLINQRATREPSHPQALRCPDGRCQRPPGHGRTC
jgi:hypothetical protein